MWKEGKSDKDQNKNGVGMLNKFLYENVFFKDYNFNENDSFFIW